MVDHDPPGTGRVDIGARCTCPSRVHPCKHAIALMVLWAQGHVASTQPPPAVNAWVRQRDSRVVTPQPVTVPGGPEPTHAPAESPGAAAGPPSPPKERTDRDRRVAAGLRELERWVDDRVRVGLGDPSIARFATWEDLATRLVDAQATGLANRVRRLAGHVGARPGWHEHVLAEMGVLHLLARAGPRLRDLDSPWADGVASTVGFTVKQADVRAGVPDTATWVVHGRSDVLEDRIVVRRTWLRAEERDAAVTAASAAAHGWALVLSFAAYGQSIDASSEPALTVGARLRADVHRYPGTVALRSLLGPVHEVLPSAPVTPTSIAGALDEAGEMLALEPWLERVPVTFTAAPTMHEGMWVLADHTGAVPLADAGSGGGADIATLLAVSAGEPVTLTGEWTALGMVVLTVHLPDRVLDIGPRGGFR
jgi:hypothetical protein